MSGPRSKQAYAVWASWICRSRPEIQAGIRSVGILDMQIYIHDNRLFMICDTTDEFDWEADNARLATLPRQAEWEAYVARFQGCDPNAPSTAKWQLMERIFKLDNRSLLSTKTFKQW